MNPLAAFLILAALAAVCAISGVVMLFGIAWGLIAAAAVLTLAAGLIRKGLNAGG